MSLERDPFDQPSFVNPWSLRVFAVTVAAAENGLFTLQDFQRALIARIRHFESQGQCIDSDESYYTRWTEALTGLLAARRVLVDSRLGPAEQAVGDAVAALREAQDHHHERPRRLPRPLFVEAAR
jgi:nitrile hydratase accessory protein